MSSVHGIHHVTCISADPQETLDFYAGVLGLRLVKKSVNQDVPDTYHLFFADAVGHPGSDLTFFPWPHLPPGRHGVGLANEVSLAIPAGALEFWTRRLEERRVAAQPVETRFGERALPFTDPHGLGVALVETADAREFTPWSRSPVPAGSQILGLHGVRIWERELEPTARMLTEVMGFTPGGEEAGWSRYVLDGGGSGRHLDLQARPAERRGSWGRGSVHHVAWRVPDDPAEVSLRERLDRAGLRPTEVIDRFWFRSVYFLEPGGTLFEIATDGPGFAVDESVERLGEALVLPPWLELHRAAIEAELPALRDPSIV
jgi:glyoxalase family protein